MPSSSLFAEFTKKSSWFPGQTTPPDTASTPALPHAVTEAGCQAAGPQVREAGKVALVTPRGPGEVGGVRAPEGVCTWTAATLRAVNANRWVPGGKLASLLRR